MTTVRTSKRSAPSPILCANCRRPIGGPTGVVPFAIHDDDGRGGGRREEWCPRCFCSLRAPLDPERFPLLPPDAHGRQRLAYTAIKCTEERCGLESVAIGLDARGKPVCGQCRTTRVIELPLSACLPRADA